MSILKTGMPEGFKLVAIIVIRRLPTMRVIGNQEERPTAAHKQDRPYFRFR
jgi:hypothetical protein